MTGTPLEPALLSNSRRPGACAHWLEARLTTPLEGGTGSAAILVVAQLVREAEQAGSCGCLGAMPRRLTARGKVAQNLELEWAVRIDCC